MRDPRQRNENGRLSTEVNVEDCTPRRRPELLQAGWASLTIFDAEGSLNNLDSKRRSASLTISGPVTALVKGSLTIFGSKVGQSQHL